MKWFAKKNNDTPPEKDEEWEKKKRKSWKRVEYFSDMEEPKENRIRKKVKNRSFIDSFGFACDGILYSVIYERNMRFDVILSAFILLGSLFFHFSRLEFALLSIVIVLVLMAEMFNTSIENICDYVAGDKYSRFIKIAKDVSAGAVLLSAMNAAIVGYLLFADKFSFLGKSLYMKIRVNPMHSTVIAAFMVIILVVLLKAFWFRGHGRPLHGGSVSGHAALAFCLATISAFLVPSMAVALLSYLLAILVTESRYEAHIHTLGELVLGALLGTVVAGLIFLIFRYGL